MDHTPESRAFSQWLRDRGHPYPCRPIEAAYNGSDLSYETWQLFDHGFFVTRLFEMKIPGVGDGGEGIVELAMVARTYAKPDVLDNPPPEWAGLKVIRLPVKLGPGTAVLVYPIAPGAGTVSYLQTIGELPAHMLNIVLPMEFGRTHMVGVALADGRDRFVLLPKPESLRRLEHAAEGVF